MTSLADDQHDDVVASRHGYGGYSMSYENAINTLQMATSCVFCNHPLIDAASVERGCGPDCADKYGVEVVTGPVDAEKLELMVDTAPEKLKTAVAPYYKSGDRKGLVQRAIWHAAVAAEYGGEHATEVLVTAHGLAQAAGYGRTAAQIAKMQIKPRAKSEIRVEHKGDLALIFTPYNAAFVAAIKTVPGRRYGKYPEPHNSVPIDKMPEAVNALVAGFPGQVVLDADGSYFAIPMLPVSIAPPVTPPAGPPTSATGETPEPRPKALRDLSIGQMVIGPDGKEYEVGWIGEKSGEARLGLRVPGQRGFTFLSYSEVKYAPKSEVAALAREEAAEHRKDAKEAGAPPPVELPMTERKIPEAMFPFQIDGVRWMDKVRSGLLADDMGLGKSLMSIIALDVPALVLCPSKLRVNWTREIAKWRPELTSQILAGRKPVDPKTLTADVVICNYDIVDAQLESLLARKWTTFIADEAHYMKTLRMKKAKSRDEDDEAAEQGATKSGMVYTGSKRAAAGATIAREARRRLLLTGTPILNRPVELWPLLHIIDPKTWNSFFTFGKRYCAGYKNRFGWDWTGSSNEQELHERINGPYMLRRMKVEVLKDLPEKRRESMEVVLSEAGAKVYSHAAREFLAWVAENGGPKAVQAALKAEALVKMTSLMRLAAEGKVEAALEWIQEHHVSTNRPLVVMGHHRTALEEIVTGCKEAKLRVGTIFGGENSQPDIDAFRDGYLDVIVCSIKAAKEGLTLTRAEEMLFLERVWVPADLAQAEDRIYRIGTKNAVQITYLDGAGTIDASTANLLMDKVDTFSKVIAGKTLSTDEAAQQVFGSMFSKDLTPNAGGDVMLDEHLAFNWLDPQDA